MSRPPSTGTLARPTPPVVSASTPEAPKIAPWSRAGTEIFLAQFGPRARAFIPLTAKEGRRRRRLVWLSVGAAQVLLYSLRFGGVSFLPSFVVMMAVISVVVSREVRPAMALRLRMVRTPRFVATDLDDGCGSGRRRFVGIVEADSAPFFALGTDTLAHVAPSPDGEAAPGRGIPMLRTIVAVGNEDVLIRVVSSAARSA